MILLLFRYIFLIYLSLWILSKIRYYFLMIMDSKATPSNKKKDKNYVDADFEEI